MEPDDIEQHFSEAEVDIIRNVFNEVFTEEAVHLDLTETDEKDQGEILRDFVEKVAIRVAMICVLLKPDDDSDDEETPELRITADDLTILIRSVLQSGSSKITIITD